MTRKRTNSVAGVTIRQFQNGNQTASRVVGGKTETIEDVNHGGPPRGGQLDVGGPMLLERNGTTHTPALVRSGSYRGSQFYLQGIGLGARPTILTDAQVKGEGATAVARSTPTTPVFDATTFIGETMQAGFPAMASLDNWKELTGQFKRISERTPDWHRPGSSEFLNYQFGWLPFLSDMRNFSMAAKNSTQIIQDLNAGSGKNTRVGYHFPETKTTNVGFGNRLLVRPDNVAGDAVAASWVQEAGARLWFNGCFTYYIPMGNGTADKMRRFNAYANKLYGVRLTPGALWNLTPWSWALDWFGNTGDVLQNISALGNDSQVMKYGYMMYHNYAKSTTTSLAAGVYTSAAVVQVSEVKKRFQAQPYRLFTGSGELTPRQIAIIAALGINRA